MLNVGLFGATGYMGAPFAWALIKAHRAGHLRFITLLRPETNPEKYPRDIERRVIDLSPDGDLSHAQEQLHDLHVVISAMSWNSQNPQYRLIDALKGSPKLLTFFPSEYATPVREVDGDNPFLTHSSEKLKVHEYCKSSGVPYTVIANATTPELLFNLANFSAFDVRKNRLNLYWPTGEGRRGLTSKEFSGQALVHLVLGRPEDLPHKVFSFVEIPFSAHDLIDVFTTINDGEVPEIIKYTEDDYQRDIKKDFFSAMGASSKKGLALGVDWPGEIVSSFPGWVTRSLEDYVRETTAGEPLDLFKTGKSSDLSSV